VGRRVAARNLLRRAWADGYPPESRAPEGAGPVGPCCATVKERVQRRGVRFPPRCSAAGDRGALGGFLFFSLCPRPCSRVAPKTFGAIGSVPTDRQRPGPRGESGCPSVRAHHSPHPTGLSKIFTSSEIFWGAEVRRPRALRRPLTGRLPTSYLSAKFPKRRSRRYNQTEEPRPAALAFYSLYDSHPPAGTPLMRWVHHCAPTNPIEESNPFAKPVPPHARTKVHQRRTRLRPPLFPPPRGRRADDGRSKQHIQSHHRGPPQYRLPRRVQRTPTRSVRAPRSQTGTVQTSTQRQTRRRPPDYNEHPGRPP